MRGAVCDIAALAVARGLVAAQRGVLPATAGPPEAGEEQVLEQVFVAPDCSPQMLALRHPLPLEAELAAWEELAGLCRRTLASPPMTPAAADEALLAAARMAGRPEPVVVLYRLGKKRLLGRAATRLEACVSASRATGRLVLHPPPPPLPLQGGDGDMSSLEHLGLDLDAQFTAQAAAMPPAVRALLIERRQPAAVAVDELFRALRLPEASYKNAMVAVAAPVSTVIRRVPALLEPSRCAALRAAVASDRRTTGVDTVDGAADHQLNLGLPQLAELIGREALDRLSTLGEQLLPADLPADSADSGCVEAFVRMYSRGTRPWIPFHNDARAVTVNVALSDDAAHVGGRLLIVAEGEVRAVERVEGEATAHVSSVTHAVSAMGAGCRYSLIMFFGSQLTWR